MNKEELKEKETAEFEQNEENQDTKKKKKHKSALENQEDTFVAQPEETTIKNPPQTDDGEAEELKKRLDEEKEKYMRLYADFDNFRKRSLRERQDSIDYGACSVAEKLLPVLDNFERAMAQGEDGEFKKGMEMIFSQLKEMLSSIGVSEIKAEGEKFDPNLHHAVATSNENDIEDDIITHCLQVGYLYKDKVIRPSMVRVNKL